MTTKLQIKNLSKVFHAHSRDIVALESIDLDVKEGEFVSIVGTSGCGKSTLLNIVAGLTDYTEGSVVLNGQTISGPGPDRAVVFQSDATFPWLSVRDNIEYGLKIKKIAKEKRTEISNDLLELLELTNFANVYPKELSGGMRKRIDIGRAYAVAPEILLMDEPFGALDVVTRENMQEELLHIWSTKKTTIIFVTHDIEEAMLLSDRIVLLSPRPGRIKDIIDVPFARPRDSKLRESKEFYDFRIKLREIWDRE
ncbi:ABC transporter ATP-binding protein [Calidifontibacillus oryziterrae]|uniref:ABC transporter ATP-binding protein n=1 Tax=Calidifontibacillus oryziterrae TaxID=1191699 RepID=UPI00031A1D9D|nr:ABC transporter ATP-binding protein [Calidifontibacillus oryziterrae]